MSLCRCINLAHTFSAVFSLVLASHKGYSRIERVAEKGQKEKQRYGTVSIQRTNESDTILHCEKGMVWVGHNRFAKSARFWREWTGISCSLSSRREDLRAVKWL